jgi:hypothetical protein
MAAEEDPYAFILGQRGPVDPSSHTGAVLQEAARQDAAAPEAPPVHFETGRRSLGYEEWLRDQLRLQAAAAAAPPVLGPPEPSMDPRVSLITPAPYPPGPSGPPIAAQGLETELVKFAAKKAGSETAEQEVLSDVSRNNWAAFAAAHPVAARIEAAVNNIVTSPPNPLVLPGRIGEGLFLAKKDDQNLGNTGLGKPLGAVVLETAGVGLASTAAGVGEGVVDIYSERARRALDPLRAEVRDRLDNQSRREEALELREAKTGRPQDSVGRLRLPIVPGNLDLPDLKAGDAPNNGGQNDEKPTGDVEQVGKDLKLGVRKGADAFDHLARKGNPQADDEHLPPGLHQVTPTRFGLMNPPLAPGFVLAPEMPAPRSYSHGPPVPALPALPSLPGPPEAPGRPSLPSFMSSGDSSMSSVIGSIGGALSGAIGQAGDAIRANPGAVIGAVAGSAAVAGAVAGGVGLVKARRKKAKKSSPKRKAAKRASARASGSVKRKTKKRPKAKKSSRRREDRSGVTRSKYKGQKVYRTKQGRPYVIRKSGPMKGMAKFIPS